MPEGLKTFFDTYANAFVAIGAVATVLGLLWAFFTYFRPRSETVPESTGARTPNDRDSRDSIVGLLIRRAAKGARVAWQRFGNAAQKVRYFALYYIPGIKYELPAQKQIVDDRLAAELSESTVFFSERFSDAFPALQELTTFDSTSDIAHRLAILFRAPIVAWSSQHERRAPFFWRGGLGNNRIHRWTRIKPRLFLMDIYELDIARIVAIPSVAYWQNFVYVECRAMPPTGLYPPPENLVGLPNRLPSAEEYAVYGHRIFTRAEYDDGGYDRHGRVKQFRHSPQLRYRRIVPFNFLIVPALCPANRSQFDRPLALLLAQCLRDPEAVHALAEWMFTLPKREPHD